MVAKMCLEKRIMLKHSFYCVHIWVGYLDLFCFIFSYKFQSILILIITHSDVGSKIYLSGKQLMVHYRTKNGLPNMMPDSFLTLKEAFKDHKLKKQKQKKSKTKPKQTNKQTWGLW